MPSPRSRTAPKKQPLTATTTTSQENIDSDDDDEARFLLAQRFPKHKLSTLPNSIEPHVENDNSSGARCYLQTEHVTEPLWGEAENYKVESLAILTDTPTELKIIASTLKNSGNNFTIKWMDLLRISVDLSLVCSSFIIGFYLVLVLVDLLV